MVNEKIKELNASIHNLIIVSDLLKNRTPENLQIYLSENKYELEQLNKYTKLLSDNLKLMKLVKSKLV